MLDHFVDPRCYKVKCHWVISVRIWSVSGPYFPSLGLNTAIYRVNVPAQIEIPEQGVKYIQS